MLGPCAPPARQLAPDRADVNGDGTPDTGDDEFVEVAVDDVAMIATSFPSFRGLMEGLGGHFDEI